MGSSGTIREAGDDHLQDGPPSLVSTHPKDEVHRRLWQPAHTHHPSTSFWVHPRVVSCGIEQMKPGPEMTGQELPALRTCTSHTYLGSDGTYQAQVFSGSINYQDANGAW
jgi:hypothetical protein